MRTKTPEQSEKILNVAVRLFATHRFHEARMEDIAAAACVGKGTLYRYFKDKEELYTALLERASDQLLERVKNAAEHGDDPIGKLEALMDAFLTFHDEQPHVLDLIQHAEALAGPDHYFPWQNTRAKVTETLTNVLKDGQKRGLFHFTDLNLALMLLLGGVRGIIRFGDKPLPANAARQIVELFLFGVSPQEESPASPVNSSRGKKNVASAR